MDCKCLSWYDSPLLPYQRVLNNEVLLSMVKIMMIDYIKLKYHNENTYNNQIKKAMKMKESIKPSFN